MAIHTLSILSALANDIRLRCIALIESEGELCVCELTHALHLSQPMISRHLALLRDAGLVSDRRAGQWVYYRLNKELNELELNIIKSAVNAVQHEQLYMADRQALQSMTNRPGAACCS